MAIFPLGSIAQPVKAYALIVGLKTIDEANYQAKYHRSYNKDGISGVDLDCDVIKKIAKENKYAITLLRDTQATKKQILSSLEEIGKLVQKDTGKVSFMLYFSGHGDIIPDKNGDEASKFDQVLVAYDDFVIDDEIYVMLKKYFTKSQNLMIVDACHSGSDYKIFLAMDFARGSNKANFFANEKKAMNTPSSFAPCSYDNKGIIKEPFNLLYFGACGDNDLAGGGALGGALTRWLDKVIRDAKYFGDWKTFTYRTLACRIVSKMKAYKQSLTYREIGEHVNLYNNNQPFKID